MAEWQEVSDEFPEMSVLSGTAEEFLLMTRVQELTDGLQALEGQD